MDPQALTQVDRLLCACLEQPDERWEQAVDDACSAHPALAPELRRRFDSLRALGLAGDDEAEPRELSSELVGDFRILRPLGGGGMGVVYLAWSMSRGLPVALKLLRPELLRLNGARQRFRREMEIMQRLDHPGICPVYEYGEVDGTPHLAMKLIEGPSLAETIVADRAHGRRPESGELSRVLECFEALAEALDEAHRHGLVHRDVKPANVLIDAAGQPILVDFGLARQLDIESGFQTDAGAFVGTPAYAAPEVLAGAVPDARMDVYSLGVSLYERLTLELPWNAPTWQALVVRIEREPEPDVRRKNPAVSSAVAHVVRTAMAKDPRRRYQSARALAADLSAVRHGRPTAARPPGLLQRAARWAAHYPAAAGLVAVLAVGFLATGWLSLRLSSTLRVSRALGLAAVAGPIETGDPDLSVLLARRAAGALEHPATLSRLLNVVTNYHPSRTVWRHDNRVRLCRYSQDGERLVALDDRNRLAVLDPKRAQANVSLWPSNTRVVDARLSSDGTQLLALDLKGVVRLWNPATDPEATAVRTLGDGLACAFVGAEDRVTRVVCDPLRGLLLVAQGEERVLADTCVGNPWLGAALASNGRVVAWDAGGLVAAWDAAGERQPDVEVGERADVFCASDGLRFAVCPQSDKRQLAIWTLTDDGPAVHEIELPLPVRTGGIVLAPEGGHVLTLHANQVAYVWNATGELVGTISAQRNNLESAAFGPRGRQVLGGHGDGVVRLYDLGGNLITEFRGHAGHAERVAFAPDGAEIATASIDGTVRTWSVQPAVGRLLAGHRGPVASVDADRDGRILTASWDGEIWLWDADREVSRALPWSDAEVNHARFTADGGAIACGRDGLVRRWDRQGEIVDDWHAAGAEGAWPAEDVALGRAGTVYAACRGGGIRAWTSAGEDFHIECPGEALSLDLSPDGLTLAAAGLHSPAVDGSLGWVRLYRAGDGEELDVPALERAHDQLVHCVRWAPDGDRIATASRDNTAKLWRIERRGAGVEASLAIDVPPRTLGPHGGTVSHVAFSPDSRRVATASTDGTVRLWSLNGEELLSAKVHHGMVWSVAFLPGDGRRLISGSFDRSARVWSSNAAELMDVAQRLVPRELTGDERGRYARYIE